MGSNSLLKLCLVVSLCIHFSLSFFPFCNIPQAHRQPIKFVELVFLKAKENKHSFENEKILPENKSNSLRASSVANSISDISKVSGVLKNELDHTQDKKSDYNGTVDKIVVIAERLELNLADLGNKESLNLFTNYAQLLRVCIINNISYPKEAFQENIEGRVQLKFVLLPDGNLKDIYVVKSSNSLILDVAAIHALKKANPFPPFPKNLKAKELFVKVPIIYKLN